MTENPLKGLYLTRLYRDGSDPFQVVTDHPREEAIALASKFAPKRYVHGKKGDQAAYMEGRLETEDWLRENARQAGVVIARQNPVYFTLTAEPQEGLAKNGMKAISIPAEAFDLSSSSFTYGDSMGIRSNNRPDNVEPSPLPDTVMNAKQAVQAIKQFGLRGDYIHGGMYIEVQVWADPREAMKKPAVAQTSEMPKVSKQMAMG